jgi:ATP-dependent 26S proteasome regulatory subunit
MRSKSFVPPSYLERICIIINEADRNAQERATVSAQRTNKTEHIVSWLDGTLDQYVIEEVINEDGIQFQQKLLVLMRCNRTERLDAAMLRQGRVDFTCEFTYKFV